MADPYNPSDLSPMMQRFVKAGKALITAFAAPVRGAFDIIQNSVVTAALTWSLFFCALVGVLEYRHGDNIRSLYSAAAEANRELAIARQIQNQKNDTDGTIALGTMGPFIVQYQAEVTDPTPTEAGVVVEFYPAKNATQYYIVWQVSDKQGMRKLENPTPNADGKVIWFLPKSYFASSFTSNRLMTFTLYASNGVSQTRATGGGQLRIP